MFFPKELGIPKAPPMKSQGIKTKLTPHLAKSFSWNNSGRFIEPFAGTCVVSLNLRPDRVWVNDINPHAMMLMRDIRDGKMTEKSIREFLEHEGEILSRRGKDHYLEVRARFNENGGSHDLIFLNRAGFNGMVRFNGKGKLNVPFCQKPNRFSKSYITKIANLVSFAAKVMQNGDWEFSTLPWEDVFSQSKQEDFLYLDPPYTARHADYYSAWKDEDSEKLAQSIKKIDAGWAYSMWLSNRHRVNTHLLGHFENFPAAIIKHSYHVGAKETMRGEVSESIVIKPGYETDFCVPLALSK